MGPEVEPWRARVAGTADVLRRGLRPFLGYEFLARLIATSVFAPALAWLLGRLIAWSGSGAISNYDLARFFLSLKGALFVAAVSTATFALAFFEFGGLIALTLGLLRHERLRLAALLRFLVARLPELARLGARQFLGYLVRGAPCLAVAGGAYAIFLTKNDINYYLYAKPPAFWAAAAIATVAGLLFAVLALRLFIDWIYALPLVLTGSTPAAALDESRALVRGRRTDVLGTLVRWALWALVLYGALWATMIGLRALLLGLAGERIGLVLATTALLGVTHAVLAAIASVLLASTLAVAITRQFVRLRDARVPTALVATTTDAPSRSRRLLGSAWFGAIVFAAATGVVAWRLAHRIAVDEHVLITAHRGSSIAAPENTMAAIELAIEEGADVVEIDVQETADGVVVLAHDKDLNRVFGIDKGIWEVRYDELRDRDSGGWFAPAFRDQRIATLAQVIDAVKGRARLNIELKFNGHERHLAREVVRILRDRAFVDQCIVTSLDYAGLRRAAALEPSLRTGLIVTSSIGDVTTLDVDLLSVSAGAITRDLVARAHARNLEVHVWTVNDVPTMNTMISIGADSIITDVPKRLGDLLRERAALSRPERMLLHLADIAERRF